MQCVIYLVFNFTGPNLMDSNCAKKIYKYNMHVPSTVQNQLFIFIIYDVPHIPHLLEDGLQLRISGPCKN